MSMKKWALLTALCVVIVGVSVPETTHMQVHSVAYEEGADPMGVPASYYAYEEGPGPLVVSGSQLAYEEGGGPILSPKYS